MQLSDFDFDLPSELIAQFPIADRSGSRLLRVDAADLGDHIFRDLPGLLEPGDLLVLNDTRVIRARLLGHKDGTGGAVEALVERITEIDRALAMVRASKTPRPGARLRFGQDVATVEARENDLFMLHFDAPVLEVLERSGRTPLPPYIEHEAGAEDEQRYQTVYAREPGAVAAPTAGLHFDDALFARLEERGIRRTFVTLHVGAGTFQPVRTEDLSKHQMHRERYAVSEETAQVIAATRAAGGRIVAVGTTSMRTLEAAALDDGTVRAGSGDTDLFIVPGYRFKVVDRLVTNFHLPRSTLMMLVSAFAGVEPIRRAYAHAIAQRYRFFSYGDAMLLERA